MCITATWFADQAKIFNSLRTCMQTSCVSHRNAFEELSANDKLEGGRDVCQSASLHLQPEPGTCEVMLLDTVWSWGLGKLGGWGREVHTERKVRSRMILHLVQNGVERSRSFHGANEKSR